MLAEAPILVRLRKLCLALPGATETVTFGHPTFQVNGKTFSVLEEYKGELGICVKVEKELQGIFLDDSRFFRTPYIGQHGWVTLRAHASRLNWTEIRDLVRGSYRLVLAGRPPILGATSKRKRRSGTRGVSKDG
jgi:predicted DNA-binding protein (MmcQ/YjbR family)